MPSRKSRSGGIELRKTVKRADMMGDGCHRDWGMAQGSPVGPKRSTKQGQCLKDIDSRNMGRSGGGCQAVLGMFHVGLCLLMVMLLARNAWGVCVGPCYCGEASGDFEKNKVCCSQVLEDIWHTWGHTERAGVEGEGNRERLCLY